MKYTLLLADDNLKLAKNLSLYIHKNISDLVKIIGVTNNGETAMEIIKNSKPDILLLDLKMPKLNGLEVIRRTKKDSIMTMVITGEISMINKIELEDSINIKKIYIKPFPIYMLLNDLKYICTEKNKTDIRKRIEKELEMFQFNKNSIGYKYLIECLIYTCQNSNLLDNMESSLFPLVAKKFKNKKGSNIKWANQKTIKSMIRYTPKDKIEKTFHEIKIPTIKFFLITINNLINDK